MSSEKYSHNDHAKTRDPDDFWGQVNRTVNNKSVGEDQIDLILEAARAGLELEARDYILDIACGNGALSDRVFADCQGGHGVDSSEYLINVAQRAFGSRAGVQYTLANAVDFVTSFAETKQFTKALWYGAIMYFATDDVHTILIALRERFPNIERCFIGNIPDPQRKQNFFGTGPSVADLKDSHETAMGLWRSEDELSRIARRSGWNSAFHYMPRGFYAFDYRYDAILTPAPRTA